MTLTSTAIGKKAEQLALRYLKKQGLSLLHSNYRCRSGEIDLIMRDQGVIVFVEVRSRNNRYYGSALESITQAKITRIIKTAQHYLMGQTQQEPLTRFDVVAIEINATINWIKDAFRVE